MTSVWTWWRRSGQIEPKNTIITEKYLCSLTKEAQYSFQQSCKHISRHIVSSRHEQQDAVHMLINGDCCNYLVAFVSLSNEMGDYKRKFPNPCNPLLLKSFQFVTERLRRRHAPLGEDGRSTKNGNMALRRQVQHGSWFKWSPQAKSIFRDHLVLFVRLWDLQGAAVRHRWSKPALTSPTTKMR